MSTLTIYKDDHAGSTVISNRFIDEFMVDANDAQIKVYLYLLRMTSANLPTSISDIADKFNHTEKDVMRSLRFWEKSHLLSLEFNDSKELTGIRFTTPTGESVQENRPLAPIVPLKLVPDTNSPKPVSRDELKKFKEAPDTSQILFVAETYLKRTLTLSDIETLYFIHYELGFTCELTDYLLQYCVEKGKTSFSYIKKVALNLAEAGVTTPKQARVYFSSYDKSVYTIMKALGKTTAPTEKEAEIITKWYKEYALPLDVINEACNRTVLATDSHRLEYCDKIISSWFKAGVSSLTDILNNDAAHKRTKPTAPATAKNSFNQFDRADYDFEAIEKLLQS